MGEHVSRREVPRHRLLGPALQRCLHGPVRVGVQEARDRVEVRLRFATGQDGPQHDLARDRLVGARRPAAGCRVITVIEGLEGLAQRREVAPRGIELVPLRRPRCHEEQGRHSGEPPGSADILQAVAKRAHDAPR